MEESRHTKKCFIALHSEVLAGEYGPLNWVGQVSKLLHDDTGDTIRYDDTWYDPGSTLKFAMLKKPPIKSLTLL